MIPGTDARHHNHAVPCADLYKSAQVALPLPVILAFDLLVMNSDHAGSHNVDSGGLYLEDLSSHCDCG
jgi:hypothetical protein